MLPWETFALSAMLKLSPRPLLYRHIILQMYCFSNVLCDDVVTHPMERLPLQGRGVSMSSPGRPWEAQFRPLSRSWLTRSWRSRCLDPRTRSPETHKHSPLSSYRSRSEAHGREKLNHFTHKVPVHLLHPVSHARHHVVEHAERVPGHFLQRHKRGKEKPTKAQRSWTVGRCMPQGRWALSAHKPSHHVYKHTSSELNVAYMCSIWGNVTRTFTF